MTRSAATKVFVREEDPGPMRGYSTCAVLGLRSFAVRFVIDTKNPHAASCGMRPKLAPFLSRNNSFETVRTLLSGRNRKALPRSKPRVSSQLGLVEMRFKNDDRGLMEMSNSSFEEFDRIMRNAEASLAGPTQGRADADLHAAAHQVRINRGNVREEPRYAEFRRGPQNDPRRRPGCIHHGEHSGRQDMINRAAAEKPPATSPGFYSVMHAVRSEPSECVNNQ